MQEKLLKNGPGVLVGLTTNERYKGSALFYDGSKLILDVDLSEDMPEQQTPFGAEPGLCIDIFCEESIRVEYPKQAEIEFFVD